MLTRRKVAKHFTVDVGEDHLRYARNQDSIAAEAKLDGIYVLRTSVAASDLGSGEVVSSCKALAQVERAFRAFSTDLDIRPVRHRTKDPVRAHVFLRMISYYITCHMQAQGRPGRWCSGRSCPGQRAGWRSCARAGRRGSGWWRALASARGERARPRRTRARRTC